MFSPAILCYNRDHFTEKALLEPDSSWSWDELFETAEKLAIENERMGRSLKRLPTGIIKYAVRE
jgi:multiple sugar transport system substrate-binding protein